MPELQRHGCRPAIRIGGHSDARAHRRRHRRPHQVQPRRAVARHDLSRHLQVRRTGHDGHRHRHHGVLQLRRRPAGGGRRPQHDHSARRHLLERSRRRDDRQRRSRCTRRRSTSCGSTTSSSSASTITCTRSGPTSPTWGRRARSASTSQYETAPQSHRFTVPETTLGALAADFQKRLGAKALRVVGDPNAKVSRIQLGVGYATPAVNNPDIDVVVSGEQQESRRRVRQPRVRRSTRSRSGSRRAGSCWATPSRRSRACWRWRSG